MRPKLYMNEQWLTMQFVDNAKSVEEIAKLCSVSTNTIRTQLKARGLIK